MALSERIEVVSGTQVSMTFAEEMNAQTGGVSCGVLSKDDKFRVGLRMPYAEDWYSMPPSDAKKLAQLLIESAEDCDRRMPQK